MYTWYLKAEEVCYAYLADVLWTSSNAEFSDGADVISNAEMSDGGDVISKFEDSLWFTRGWTLQELIAPTKLLFFSCDWIEFRSSRNEMSSWLQRITGIPEAILRAEAPVTSASLAKRMSWASKRETTRVEDIAYCLMGIFDVNMPLLYGEGENAFIRLQEEIIKHSDDQSLFAWEDPEIPDDIYLGLLARSPRCFTNAGEDMPYADWEHNAPFAISNKGLEIELYLSTYKPLRDDCVMATLNCPVPPHYIGFLGIMLYRLPTGVDQYARIMARKVFRLDEIGETKTSIYVRQKALREPETNAILPHHYLHLRNGPPVAQGYQLADILASNDKILHHYNLLVRHASIPTHVPINFPLAKTPAQVCAVLIFDSTSSHERVAILLGSMDKFGVGFDIRYPPFSEPEDFRSYNEIFDPIASGSNRVLGDHHVCVTMTPGIVGSRKYYVVDISMKEIELEFDEDGDAQAGLQVPSGKHDRRKLRPSISSIGKMIMPFRSPRSKSPLLQ